MSFCTKHCTEPGPQTLLTRWGESGVQMVLYSNSSLHSHSWLGWFWSVRARTFNREEMRSFEIYSKWLETSIHTQAVPLVGGLPNQNYTSLKVISYFQAPLSQKVGIEQKRRGSGNQVQSSRGYQWTKTHKVGLNSLSMKRHKTNAHTLFAWLTALKT